MSFFRQISNIKKKVSDFSSYSRNDYSKFKVFNQDLIYPLYVVEIQSSNVQQINLVTLDEEWKSMNKDATADKLMNSYQKNYVELLQKKKDQRVSDELFNKMYAKKYMEDQKYDITKEEGDGDDFEVDGEMEYEIEGGSEEDITPSPTPTPTSVTTPLDYELTEEELADIQREIELEEKLKKEEEKQK